jgi:hypothetical protein
MSFWFQSTRLIIQRQGINFHHFNYHLAGKKVDHQKETLINRFTLKEKKNHLIKFIKRFSNEAQNSELNQ